ncbi:dihydroxyacetone kinase family protein [Herbiconiux ginsengi]|uniref:Homodimeric dihydroxyacetone kinase n=1 Tax=Herbiconiux ginsengi TaxID=381665 RepID=A0A1H3U2M2_9MICO|nr:dihydroxyacetone kinase family protein [Herbiconiux ginsengi]SDZ56703.1 homodimeric dihydroxyacetone kinase [Herbiconiux ginsengi]
MTHVANDPARFREDMLNGFLDLYSGEIAGVPGGVVRAVSAPGKVAVVVGGGSGHYPAFHGIVGPGFADGAVVGNIFTSPSRGDAVSVCRAASNGAGVLLMAGNYAGDVMNFGQAAAQLTSEGIVTETFFVTDDIASAPLAEKAKRRGIAGDFAVFKIAAAAAEAGLALPDVVEITARANDRTRTLGVGFAGATMPGATSALFSVDPGLMEIGLGIHGEAGLRDVDLTDADTLAGILVDQVLAECPAPESRRIAVVVNGLGSTKYEELFVLWAAIAPRLRDAGYELIRPEVGELVTSLDMSGCSLTLTWLDDDLERYWLAPASTPAFARGTVSLRAEPRRDIPIAQTEPQQDVTGTVTDEQAAAGQLVATLFSSAAAIIAEHEDELGTLDAIAGDGDHGRGMRRGIDAASTAATQAAGRRASAGRVLATAGQAWADNAGGTSGVLWGAALTAAATTLGDHVPNPKSTAAAIAAAVDAIRTLGKAELGDKTMLDALIPFRDRFRDETERGSTFSDAWRAAATVAEEAAAATSSLSPRVGRARPLSERSIGHPDPGATSFALIVNTALPNNS